MILSTPVLLDKPKDPVLPDQLVVEHIEQVLEKPQVKLQVVETERKKFSKYDIDCLATNLFHEARGEPEEGILAVALVTYNRLKSDEFPKRICDVVYEPHQFSWTSKKPKIKNWKRWHELHEFSKYFLTEYIYESDDITNGAKFYHADYVRPDWARSFEQTIHIGRHKFYRGG